MKIIITITYEDVELLNLSATQAAEIVRDKVYEAIPSGTIYGDEDSEIWTGYFFTESEVRP